MRVLKSIDERVWLYVLKGQIPRIVTTTSKGSDPITIPKPLKNWYKIEYDSTGRNSEGLNAIFNVIISKKL